MKRTLTLARRSAGEEQRMIIYNSLLITTYMTISHKPDEFVPNTFMCYLPEDADTNTFVILYSQNGCRYNKPTAFKGKALLVTPNILELEYDKVTQFALYINSNMSSFTIQQKRRNPKDFKFSLAGFKDARIWKHLYLESIEN